MRPEVEVVLYHLCDDDEAIQAAYHESSERMAGVPGLLGNQLTRSAMDPRKWTVVSRWASWEAFQEWEGSPGHLDQTAPLRPWRNLSLERPFEVCRVVAGYGSYDEAVSR